MSRQTINEEIRIFGSQLRKGMDNLTIVDPGRLRVPFGGVGKAPKKQSWMTVSNSSGIPDPYNTYIGEEHDGADMQDVVMDIVKQPNLKISLDHTNPMRQGWEQHWEIKGWTLSLGYSLFGLVMALCNLFSSSSASRVCTAMSPIPMLCLLFQALFCMDPSNRQVSSTCLEACGLVLSALILPSACVFWNLYISMPLVLFLSLVIVSCIRQKTVLVWVCISGVCLSLAVAAPSPAMQILEPRWGMTVAFFSLGILCFQAGMNYGGIEFKIK